MASPTGKKNYTEIPLINLDFPPSPPAAKPAPPIPSRTQQETTTLREHRISPEPSEKTCWEKVCDYFNSQKFF